MSSIGWPSLACVLTPGHHKSRACLVVAAAIAATQRRRHPLRAALDGLRRLLRRLLHRLHSRACQLDQSGSSALTLLGGTLLGHAPVLHWNWSS